jgi:hypothetical protein
MYKRIFIKYYFNNKIKEDELDESYNMNGREEKCWSDALKRNCLGGISIGTDERIKLQ